LREAAYTLTHTYLLAVVTLRYQPFQEKGRYAAWRDSLQYERQDFY
jgi:hypothetical protein